MTKKDNDRLKKRILERFSKKLDKINDVTLDRLLNALKSSSVEVALMEHNNNKTIASEILKCSRRTIHKYEKVKCRATKRRRVYPKSIYGED